MIAAGRGITQPRRVDLGSWTPNRATGVPMLHIAVPPGSTPPGGRKSLKDQKRDMRFDVAVSSTAADEVM